MSDEARARQRFAILSLVRVIGLVMVLGGIAAHQGALPLPDPAGVIVAIIGLFGFFFLPNILARRWRTKDQ